MLNIPEKTIQAIQDMKAIGMTQQQTAKKLRIHRNTVIKYWKTRSKEDYAEKTDEYQMGKKEKRIHEEKNTISISCPNCNTALIFLKTEKKVQCPFCDKIYEITLKDENKVMRDRPLGTTKFPRYPHMC